MSTITQGQIAKIFFNGYKGNLQAADRLAKDMKRLIDEAVDEAARLCADQRPGFEFRRHPVMRQKLEEIICRLRQQMESTIEQGSKDAWIRAEATTSKVVETMALGNPKLASLLSAGLNVKQNDRALEAFQGRVINGMRLSDRVWNLTAQTQTQIEQGIEIALAEGTPAAKLSRRVRNCLQNPNDYFRRFAYKIKEEPLFDDKGNPILDSSGKQMMRPVYGRKWKRRYVDADGNTRWQDVSLNDYRYGRGVYRSAYKNAMRMARTEINMAYQTSDHERWKRSWWVKGIRVGLSNNHPVADICNDLAGDYPADFKFIGWHPQCRCFAHAITATSEEIQDYYRRKRAGEDMSEYEVPGKIKEMPAGAKQWISANQPRLEKAKANGTVPFFVSDNAKYTGAQFAPKPKPTTSTQARTSAVPTAEAQVTEQPKKTTIQERATARHAARTEEEIAGIQARWNKRCKWNKLEARLSEIEEYANANGVKGTASAIAKAKEAIKKKDYQTAYTQIGTADGKVYAHKIKAQAMPTAQNKQTAPTPSNPLPTQRTKQKASTKIDVGNTATQADHYPKPKNDAEKVDIIMRDLGIKDRLRAREYLSAISGYTNEWDWEIRQYQMGNRHIKSQYGHTMAEIAKKAKDTEEYIRLAPKWAGAPTYRGMSMSQKDLESLLASLQDGTCSMRGCASFSTSQDIAQCFAKKYIGETSSHNGGQLDKKVVLIAKQHTKAASIYHLSEKSVEREVLSSMECRWRLVKVHKPDKDGFIFVEIAPSN